MASGKVTAFADGGWRSRGWCIIIAVQGPSMNRTLAMVTVALTLLVGVLWIPSAAAKPKKVALTPIEGDSNGDLGDQVVEALDGEELSTLSTKVVNRAIDKLGYEGELDEKQARKVAKELEA